MSINPITSCRSCGSIQLTSVLSLGDIAVVDFPVKDKAGLNVPLELILCSRCKLLQLRHTTPPEILYGKTYWYMSGVNQTMKDELAGITQEAEKRIKLKPGDLVVDIGCNDGTLLSFYRTSGVEKVGFDPAENLAQFSRKHVDQLFVDFFHKKPFQKKYADRKAKIITAISMFYDIEDPNVFLSDIVECLDKDGILIIQQNYLARMITQNAFDNICHEHLEYYSLESMENLLKKHNLEVFDVEERILNGGSFRTYIQKIGAKRNVSSRVAKLRIAEKKLGLDKKETYVTFARQVRSLAEKLHNLIANLVSQHKSIYIYGASTRGNTLLQYCRLDHTLIAGAAERNPIKWGKQTVKTFIPILSEEEVRKKKPDYMLVLPWFFKKEFVEREKVYLKSGGKFIFPLPQLKIVHK